MNDPPPDDASRGRQWSLWEMCLLVGWCAFFFAVIRWIGLPTAWLLVPPTLWATLLAIHVRRRARLRVQTQVMLVLALGVPALMLTGMYAFAHQFRLGGDGEHAFWSLHRTLWLTFGVSALGAFAPRDVRLRLVSAMLWAWRLLSTDPPRPERDPWCWSLRELLALVVWCAVWLGWMRWADSLFLLTRGLAFAWATTLVLFIRAGQWARARLLIAMLLLFVVMFAVMYLESGGALGSPHLAVDLSLMGGVAFSVSLGTSLLDWSPITQTIGNLWVWLHSAIDWFEPSDTHASDSAAGGSIPKPPSDELH